MRGSRTSEDHGVGNREAKSDRDEPMLGNAKQQHNGMVRVLAPIGYYYEPEPYNMRACV